MKEVVEALLEGNSRTEKLRLTQSSGSAITTLNGQVDAADYVVWRKTDGTPAGYNVWRMHFGEHSGSGAGLGGAELMSAAVPEPMSALLLIFGATVAGCYGRRGAKREERST